MQDSWEVLASISIAVIGAAFVVYQRLAKRIETLQKEHFVNEKQLAELALRLQMLEKESLSESKSFGLIQRIVEKSLPKES